ncbi:MAG: hypothetical protein QME68_02550, partial [Elusimicrobiota bacterium]|nr:hypothetical protein [Elusimicrobiota bacterium]
GGRATYGKLPSKARHILIIHSDKVSREKISKKFIQFLFELEKSQEYINLLKKGFFPDIFPVYFNKKQLEKDLPWVLLDIQDHGIVLYDPQKVVKRTFERVRASLRRLGSKKYTCPMELGTGT